MTPPDDVTQPDETTQPDDLPSPTAERWQPLRAGLVDLYYYDDQQFLFHDGRLLLRGNNGAGKSKVLALLLPFLLDGETGGHRLEPDGDAAKRMEWNLLLGGEHPNPERTGYTWLELGRRDADGLEHHRTLGFGVKAARGRGVVKRWFFTTTARVGVDLHLLDATRTALTAERLGAALEGRGQVVDTARAYRALVDEALFGLGEARYAALVDLLVQLRQPQLSRRPSEARLSDALTSALPPLDQAVLSDVAETFRSLEEDRETLARAQEGLAGARDFLGHYRRYARAAARRAAEPVRRAQSRHDALGREAAEAARDVQAAERDHDAAAGRRDAAAEEVEVLAERARTLADDPRHRSVEAVDAARAQTERAAGELAAAAARAEQAAARSRASRTAHERARADAASARSLVAALAASAGARAAECGLPAPQDLAAGSAGALDLDSPPLDLAPWRRAAATAVERRRRQLERVTALAAQEAVASSLAERAAGELDRLDSEAASLEERAAAAAGRRQEAGEALVRAITAWAGALAELPLADPAALLAAVEAWTVALDGRSPAEEVVGAARDAAVRDLAEQRARVRREEADAVALVAALREEFERLGRGGHLPPTPSPTRDAGARAQRPGAPLWRLVDVRPSLSEDGAAGLEAALEGAGLLDAWVAPDASLVVRDDVVLRALPPPQRPARSLAEVLVPSLPEGRAGGLEQDAVQQVLASIALGAPVAGPAAPGLGGAPAPGAVTWVDTDGRFGSPAVAGAWHRTASEHLGAGARERARTARLARVCSELAEAAQRELDLGAALDVLDDRERLVVDEAALPSAEPLRAASHAVLALGEQRAGLRERRGAAERERAAAVSALTSAAAATAEAADDVVLPTSTGELAAVERAVGALELALAQLFPALAALARALGDVAERSAAADDDAAAEVARDQEARVRRTERAAAAEHLAVLERTLGVQAAELLAELQGVRELQRRAAAEQRAAATALEDAARAQGVAATRVSSLAEQLVESAQARAATVASLRTFAMTGLLAVALPGLDVPVAGTEWAPDPAVRLARRVEADLADVDAGDDALSRARDRVTGEARGLDDVLALDGHRAVLWVRDDQIVVEITFRGRPATLVELEAALAQDVQARSELLDAREREVISTYLVDEVASILAELIADAEAQVARMNVELERRPTTTGMRLRLVWLPREDGPPGLATARERLLRQSSDAWSPADREAVGAFLTAQVRAVRAADPGGSWLDQLTRALDHRSWHRFAIQRRQNGQWRSATGPASGGERVLAASVPLFAAASAHYGSASNRHAPRLIMLDEAFAGVDDTARADYLGLLAAFDLDVVMTSEREWGCYPQVPGLGIAQLSRVEGVDAVLVTPWRWDGRLLERVPEPAGTAAPPAPGARAGEDQPGLFE